MKSKTLTHTVKSTNAEFTFFYQFHFLGERESAHALENLCLIFRSNILDFADLVFQAVMKVDYKE